MPLTAGFEKGTNGNTIATSDPGHADPWSTVSIGTGASVVYDNTHAAQGALGGKLAIAGTIGDALLGWFSLGNLTDHYGRFYLYATVNPGGLHSLVTAQTSAAAPAFYLMMNIAGAIRILDSASVNQGTTTASVTLNQWVRIEYHAIDSATAGSVQVLLFNSPFSTTPTETLNSTANINTAASCDRIYYGPVNNVNIGPIWMDGIVAANNVYPGPIPTMRMSQVRAAGGGVF